jgi:hypothetical protein
MSEMRCGRDDESHRLLQLLVQREGVDLDWPPAPAWDWRAFAEVCEFHQVIPYIYCRLHGLTGAAVPAGLFDHLRTRFHEICARNYELAKKLVGLASLLQNEGIPSLAYKGPSLAMAVYGGLARRHYNDLDLVIRKQHHTKAVRLLTARGFQIAPTPALPRVRPYLGCPEDSRNVERTQEVEFCAPDRTYYIDLHWQLGNLFWRPLSPDADKLWERAERQALPQGSISTLCREDLFLALCAHGTRHRWIFLKWLVDIAELLRKGGTLDWSRIEEMVRIRPGAGASASVAVILAHDLLKAPVPAEAGKVLPATSRTLALAAAVREELLSRSQTRGSEHATLLALEARPGARMKYQAVRIINYPGGLFREVIVQVSPKDRTLIRLPQRLQFLYHAIRPMRLVVKHCLHAARTLWLMAS